MTSLNPAGHDPAPEDRMSRILITLYGDEVAPRFDMCTEVLIAAIDENGTMRERKEVVLPQASAEELCQLIVSEGVDTVVCGGIEEEYYQYLTWKKTNVLDSVIGTSELVLSGIMNGTLRSGAIVVDGRQGVSHG